MSIDYNNLYITYQPKLKTRISNQIKDKDFVDDLVQEVLLKAHRKLDTYDSKYAISTWLYTISDNTVKNYYKSLKDNVSYSAEIYDNEHTELLDDPESMMIAAEKEDKYFKSLSALGDIYLEAYTMREVEGMSMDAIATKLGIPENTVKSRLKRARDYIKKEVL